MKRFFFSVNEASELVITSLENSSKLNGKILSKKMKCAKISNILDIWCEMYNCKWKKIKSRKGDKFDEHLIGQGEILNTYEFYYNKKQYLVIDHYKNQKKSIIKEYSTLNAPKLNKNEIIKLIKNRPENLF